MKKLFVLDCTLRDGGYCNNWNFGFNNSKIITERLSEAGIDIVECGFLTNKVVYNKEYTKFSSVEQFAQIIPANRNGHLYVCMINFGEYNVSDLPQNDGTSVDGIRVAFHKKDAIGAIKFCKDIKDKGYKVFVQAMASITYTDQEYLNLIDKINNLEPYAFYIVDSFGVMKRKDLMRLFYNVEHNLKDNIIIGFHSHNNLQLSYSNAQALVDVQRKHDMIIDSSVFGMGRGAGNLNTELFVEYLNDNIDAKYSLKPLLTIIDEILNNFYRQNYWGYSLPNYLSAKHNAHPNYANYLDEKKTLTVENMDEIFSMMSDEKKSKMDKAYIEELYIRYMASGLANEVHFDELREKILGKSVLIIAPGQSSAQEKDKIIKVANEDLVTFSINFEYDAINTDYIFISNLRRFKTLDCTKRSKCIVTSNIPPDGVYLQTKYADLLNQFDYVRDNAGMMLIKFLILMGASKVLIAGIDGYSYDPTQNFADSTMNFYTQKATFEAMNSGLNECIKSFKQYVSIEFVTTPKYVFA